MKQLRQQPAIRLDYQLSPKMRVTGTYGGDRQRVLTTPGLIPGFTDVIFPYPFITKYSVTANYMLSPTTFLEGTYGFIRNELTGGNEQRHPDERVRRTGSTGLAAFPLLYPDAGIVPKDSYAFEVLEDVKPPFWDGTRMNLPPTFSWGGRVGAASAQPALPRLAEHQPDAGRRDQRDEDRRPSLAQGRLLQQPQLQGAEHRRHRVPGRGRVRQRHATTRSIPSSASANAAVGVFRRYTQGSKFVEGSMLYNNTEFYVQDNWKVNNRLTLDLGVRFTRQQPQHDQFQQMSNFFPDQWKPAVGAGPLRRRLQQRRGRLLGQHEERDEPDHRADPDGPGLAQ